MKLVGLMPVRNEDWCLGLTLRAALEWCDLVAVADHWSTDGTHRILNQVFHSYGHERLVIRDDWEAEWREMEQRQMLLETARDEGATHLALIDADEILSGSLLNKIRPEIEALEPDHMLELPLFNLRGSITRCHTNGIWGNRVTAVAFKDSPELNWTGDQFHHRDPFGMSWQPVRPFCHQDGGLLHLWGASERRLRAKVAWYKMTERIRWPEKDPEEIDFYYNQFAISRQDRFEEIPPEWWAPYSQWLPMLDVNQTPWQEEECRRMLREYGAELFRGLDLLGVV